MSGCAALDPHCPGPRTPPQTYNAPLGEGRPRSPVATRAFWNPLPTTFIASMTQTAGGGCCSPGETSSRARCEGVASNGAGATPAPFFHPSFVISVTSPERGRLARSIVEAGIEGIAQTLTDEADGENGQVDHKARNEDVRPRAGIEVFGPLQHVAPRWDRNTHPEP